ncbi:MAG TPA: hypothetical protein VMC41_02515 [Candidatus Nanoarchaeia archaeon]|nr:hypothetical protein [Candidatus Nanoarchaeia archaeon]
MPNLDFNAGFEPDEAGSGGGDNLSELGFHPADEDLEEELGEDNEDDSSFVRPGRTTEDKEDFDLDDDEDTDDEISAPILGVTASGPIIAATDDDEDEEDEDDLDEDEDGEEGSADRELVEESDEEELSEDEEMEEDDSVIISKSKIVLAKRLLENIQKNSASLVSLFAGQLDDGDEERISIGEISDGSLESDEDDGRVIEGVFDGENMIGPDGKEYSVPANYASKSKLVEGDMLKLTITDRGTFIYKQTKPVERKRLIGKLEKDANGNYIVKAEHKKFRVLTASITYYKGIPGDKVVLLIPIAGDSAWGAVDNVIKSK